jgi:hypothetical protein
MPVGPLQCDRRPHPRPALGKRLSPRPTAPRRREGRCAAALRATSCATPTPLSSRTRAFHSTSSSGSWVIPTLGSLPSICRASTTPRSSPPSTPARRRRSRPPPDSGCRGTRLRRRGRTGTAPVEEQLCQAALLLLVRSDPSFVRVEMPACSTGAGAAVTRLSCLSRRLDIRPRERPCGVPQAIPLRCTRHTVGDSDGGGT